MASQIFLLILLLQSINAIEGSEFTIREATIPQIQTAFHNNKLTSNDLVDFYIHEIKNLNPIYKSVIELNPDALHEAKKADKERNTNSPKSRFKLHGIPVLVKDNIATKDKLNTTAGSYALLKSMVPRDAGVVKKLRESGAIILGKTSMSEWAHFRSSLAPNGWNARTKQAVNPYVETVDPCGSSTGSAISVATNMVDAIVGFDKHDAVATRKASNYIPHGGYLKHLKPQGLKGKRLGIVRAYPNFGFANDTEPLDKFEKHFEILRQSGATLVDDLGVANYNYIMPMFVGETIAILSEFKMSLNVYIKELVSSPVRSLTDVIAFNKKYANVEKLKEYPQDLFLEAEKTNGIGELEKEALKNMTRASKLGFEKLMKENKLDALVTPLSYGSTVLAIGGYPGISVPGGYDKNGAPFGICFGGLKGSEPTLIEIAYGFEQASKFRKPPPIKNHKRWHYAVENIDENETLKHGPKPMLMLASI